MINRCRRFKKRIRINQIPRCKHGTWLIACGNKALLLLLLFAFFVPGLVGCKGRGEEKQDRYALRLSGIEKMGLGDYAGAVADFDGAVQMPGGKIGEFEIDVLKYRAEAEYQLGDYGAAAHTYDVLLEIDGEKMEYCYQNAVMKALSGDTDGALASYADGIRLEQEGEKEKDLLGFWKKLKGGEEDGGESQEAEGQPEVSRSGSFGREEALSAVGEACLAAGRQEEAKRLFDEAIRDGTAGPKIFYDLGIQYLENKQYGEALDAFERAALAGNKILSQESEGTARAEEAGKTVRDSRFNQAVIYEHQGQYQKALNAFESYVAEFGPDEAAQKEITFLRTR